MRLKIFAGVVITLLFISIFFWLAGGWDWFRGWTFVGLLIVGQKHSVCLSK